MHSFSNETDSRGSEKRAIETFLECRTNKTERLGLPRIFSMSSRTYIQVLALALFL